MKRVEEAPSFRSCWQPRALGANKGKVLKYLNSGDVTGDQSRVVGYGAGVFYKTAGGTEKMKEEKKKVGVDLGLNEQEKEDPPSDCEDRG